MLLRRLSTFILVGAVMTMLQGCGESTPPPPNAPSTSVPYLDPANAGSSAMNPGKAATKAPDKSAGKAE